MRGDLTEESKGPRLGATVAALAGQGKAASGLRDRSSRRLASRYVSPRWASKGVRHWTMPIASMAPRASSSTARPSAVRPDRAYA